MPVYGLDFRKGSAESDFSLVEKGGVVTDSLHIGKDVCRETGYLRNAG